MKRLKFKSKTRLATSLSLALLFSISPTVLANPDWARSYVGNLSFRLTEDPGLQTKVQSVTIAQNEFTSITAKVTAQDNATKKLRDEHKAIKKKIRKLSDELTNSITKKGKLQQEKTAKVATLPGLQTEVDMAKAAVSQKDSVLKQSQAKLVKQEQKLAGLETSCAATPTAQCQKKIKRTKTAIAATKVTVKANQDALTTAKTFKATKVANLKAANKVVTKLTKKIADLDTAITTKNAQVQVLKTQETQKAAQVNIATTTLKTLKKKQDRKQVKLTDAKKLVKKYRDRLISRVLAVNKTGAQEGALDGEGDGRILSNRLGSYHGSRDGDFDGEVDGIREGKQRSHAAGYRTGQVDGSTRAEREGQEDGQIDGTEQGNIDAATRIGKVDGRERAQNSNAATLGNSQGETAGHQRAEDTGRRDGTKTGEAQAIQQFESKSLKPITLDGQFAGSFARIIPAYPTQHRGRNFNPSASYNRKIVKQAFRDGYKRRYKRRQQATYEATISRVYNVIYDDNYNDSYDEFYNRPYPAHRQAGYDQGERAAYNRDYQGHYDNSYNDFRTQFSMSPNRNSNEFKVTYSRVENSTYESVFESIRSAHYRTAEVRTFEANIARQTELFRTSRHAAVSKIYNEKPVLKFISSSITDAGINGVAGRDGIFQPGETTVHDIVVKNFGKVAAKNVKVVMENGAKFVVPSIAAGSIVKVKGVAKSQVASAPAGRIDTKILTAYAPLSAEAKIQGRHYANPSQGKINVGDTKKNKIQFPFNLSRLNTAGTLIIGEANSLNVAMTNGSSRAYTGDIKISLEVNANTNIITKNFNPVTKIASKKTISLTDATLLINDESDIYTPLTFRARVSKKGVTLGYLNSPLTSMAKAPFIAKNGKPIVVVNSDASARDLVDLLATMGGLKGASVLDTSLPTRNRAPLANGVKGKTLLVLEKAAIKSIDGMLNKSENTVMILIDELQNGYTGLKSIKTFRDAEAFNYDVAGVSKNTKVIFANPMRVGGLKSAVPALIADINSYKKYLSLANLMKLSNDQILGKIESEVTKTNFFSADTAKRQLIQMANIRAIDEVMRINKHYKLSGEGLSRDKDIADLVKDDKSLLHNRLGKLVDGKTRDKNVSLFLFAYDFYYTMRNALKHYDPIEDRIKFAVQNRMFGTLFSSGALKKVKKSYKALKKYDKKLYKKVTGLKGLHAPFEMADEGDNNSRRR
ncbi:hypothetical protein A9Q84_12620 [Halobacteriovorax marinus]|uniref:Uncharacterized protein n=1 Tax=Halobacteriovorax marinus TaxID=97084 RepID=A0A1Y5F8P7_9BACT|nr:hypothetical protein A9Q84_12620 [Halobacteriovorax marinus]